MDPPGRDSESQEQWRKRHGENLKKAREAVGHSVADVAKELDVHSNTVNNWETGRSAPSSDYLAKLAVYYKCLADGLLGLPTNSLDPGSFVIDLNAVETLRSNPDEQQLRELIPKEDLPIIPFWYQAPKYILITKDPEEVWRFRAEMNMILSTKLRPILRSILEGKNT